LNGGIGAAPQRPWMAQVLNRALIFL